ncbi:hypothetical protein N7G274_003948 [Stereocaulon virgatum]|uniref:BD-FAE-like domain-containing protein n=1 Tax=Stereocaulon virgatum TaxID=373712 RepID=A0ABR4AFP5_9LECA
MTLSTPLYTSRLSIPYSPHSHLNTLDIHTPTTPSLSPSFHLLYIHGGAFRDPLVTSTSLNPSLPSLFANRHISAIVSLNYRLSPHPHHPSHPSRPDDKSRNAKWPDHIDDVRDAVRWLQEEGGGGRGGGGGGMKGKEWIVAGHSVGGTMALMLGMEPRSGDHGWGKETPMVGLRGVVGVEGIYDFVALRDAHAGMRGLYEAFTEGAFGAEEGGGWRRGDVLRCGRRVREDVDCVVVGHSREDELVEWQQAVSMMEVLRREANGTKFLVEVKGKHQEVVTGGVGIGVCVMKCVDGLVRGH